MREHLEGDEWQERFMNGKSNEEQVRSLYDAILARDPIPDEISFNAGYIGLYHGDIPTERHILESLEYLQRFRLYNIVPGCGRPAINCTWIRKRRF
jgi:diadenosine tetraphosphatase ApaH/serine/threonine PP2A family protein phosphatase